MRRVIAILALSVAVVLAVRVSPVPGQEEQTKKPLTGKLKDGTVITEEDLKRILSEHKKWVESEGKGGRKADLSGASLSGADLREANLSGAQLSGADLSEADLMGADLSGAVLSGAVLSAARLSGAHLGGADLSEADASGADLSAADLSAAHLGGVDLSGADLREANLSEADLSGADLHKANLSVANLYKADLSEADLSEAKLQKAHAEFAVFAGTKFVDAVVSDFFFAGARRLTEIAMTSPTTVVNLRKNAKEWGFRNEERALTAALHKYRMKQGKAFYEKFLDDYLLGGKLTKYGAEPWNSLWFLAILVVPFSIAYMISLGTHRKMTGIWIVRHPDRVLKSLGKDRPIKLTTALAKGFLPYEKPRGYTGRITRWLGILWTGLYFSILSAFSIGWRELNFGVWITRLQRQEYTLRATGWVRTVSGIQSLISLYLLALWALTYFGRPFE